MDQQLRVMRILWAALCASMLLFLAVLLWLRSQGSVPDAPPNPEMLIALAVAALGSLVTSVLLPRMLARKAFEAAAKPEIVEEVDDDAVGLYRDVAPRQRVFAKPGPLRRKLAMRYQTRLILGLALSESVAIYGLVLGMTGHPLLHTAPFFAVGLVSGLLRFPTQRRIEKPAEEAYGAAFR